MKRLAPFALAALLLAVVGCHHSAKKAPNPADSKTLAADTEKDFMKRWIDKRTAELVAKGSDPQVAHQQAVADYKTTFSYTKTAQQAN